MNETSDEVVTSWTREDAKAAARQGWSVWSCDGSDYGPYQIQRYDSPEDVAEEFGPVPELEDDDAAVAAMRAAHERGEPHAIKARDFILIENIEEFERFGMGKWSRT